MGVPKRVGKIASWLGGTRVDIPGKSILDVVKALLDFDNENYKENIQAVFLKMNEKMNRLIYEN